MASFRSILTEPHQFYLGTFVIDNATATFAAHGAEHAKDRVSGVPPSTRHSLFPLLHVNEATGTWIVAIVCFRRQYADGNCSKHYSVRNHDLNGEGNGAKCSR